MITSTAAVKYLLISLFAAAQPGNHNIAMEYDHIVTVDDSIHCELLAHDLANLEYPPLANVAVERINNCIEVEFEVVRPGREGGTDRTPVTLVSQSSYKWSGVSKPIQIISIPGLTIESCTKAADKLSKITLGHRVAYNYLRIDSICI